MTIYMMCGLPASGKSTIAKEMNKPIVCLDDIRAEFYGDASIQGDGFMIYTEGLKRIKELINKGDVIYDATNTTAKRRKDFMKNFSDTDVVCIHTIATLKDCIERNAKRDRNVPIAVIERMYNQFEKPSLNEGFKKVVEISG